MGAGKYIGRVGALAVALGVGTAVGSGYGLAWADTTGTSGSSSSESSSSSSSSSSSGSTDTGSSTTSTTGESTTGTGTTTTGTTTGSTSSSETTSGSHTSESSTSGSTSTSGTQTTTGSTTTVSTGSGSSSDPKSTLSAQTVVETGTETRSTSQPTSTAPTPAVDKPSEPVPTKQPTPDPTTVPEPSTQHETQPENKSPTTSSSNNPQSATTASVTARVLSTPVNSGTEPTATSAPATNTRSVPDESALTALPSPTLTAVSLPSPAVIPPPVATPSVVVQTVTSLLSVFGIDVLAGTSPVVPAQSPLLWGLLAWVRRQVAAAIPPAPQVAVTTTSLVTGDPVPAGSPDLATPAPMAVTVDQAAPTAAVDLVAPTASPVSTAATDPTTPATLDAVPTAFAAEATTLDVSAPDAIQPTDSTGAEPMMMAAATPTTFAAPVTLAAAAVTAPAPAFPAPGAQLSTSTNFISWLTGNYPTTDTLSRFGINGTDVAIIWDNGMVDDPTTPYNEHQLLIAFGDTFGDPNAPGQQWRSNVLLRTSDLVLPDGLSIPNGTVINPADLSTYFGGAALSYVNFAKQIITDPNLGPAVTIIPTAGISVPTPGTMFGVTQYINFMAVQQWGNPGYWTTSYSAIAYSEDNGQNWTVAPSTVRPNQWWTGNQNFQQAAYVRPGDGYVYMYGTPNGRQGNAYLARVPEQSMLDLTKYQYWNGSAPAVPGQPGPAGQWVTGNPAAATAILPIETRLLVGACGALSSSRGPGSTVSEMSVQYNEYLKKYVAMYTDQNNSVVMRTSDRPQGDWSYAKVLLDQQPGGIYAPMMNPWSPSTKGTGSDLYWNLSLFNTYNVMQMRTDLKKVN